MSIKKPVEIQSVYEIFKGGEYLEESNGKNQLHFFSPHSDYAIVYSSFIMAEVDLNGSVLHLKCSESDNAF